MTKYVVAIYIINYKENNYFRNSKQIYLEFICFSKSYI